MKNTTEDNGSVYLAVHLKMIFFKRMKNTINSDVAIPMDAEECSAAGLSPKKSFFATKMIKIFINK
jgi:hypothetical protein